MINLPQGWFLSQENENHLINDNRLYRMIMIQNGTSPDSKAYCYVGLITENYWDNAQKMIDIKLKEDRFID